MKYKINIIRNYLELYPPVLIKQQLWVWLGMINFIGILIATCDPFTISIFHIIMPIVIIMDFLIIAFFFNIYRWQKEYVLFVGIWCFSMSAICIIAFYKTYYFINGYKSFVPLIFAIIIYIIVFAIIFIFNIKKLVNGGYLDNKKKPGKAVAIIVFMSGSGLILGRIIIKTQSQQITMTLFAFSLLMLAYSLEFGMINIHKYYLIKAYEEYVKVFEPPKKKTKRKSNKKTSLKKMEEEDRER